MSNIYIQEPPTSGKVMLKTTVGDIDIELWSKETPKAARNFIQLCMEGYYNNTIFHRVVQDFIVQGGDPTGTGEGGESIYGKPFKDEFHSRLRFVRRGLIAMANAGANDNGSQFFFTLAAAPELNNKHTIFGKVAGNTIYNMLKLGEAETDGNERPIYPHKVLKTKVLSNPFSDIVPRVSKKEKGDEEVKRKKSLSKATKNFNLLSFGEEAEEDEEEVDKATQSMRGKSKSSHDLLDDAKLSSTPALDTDEKTAKRSFLEYQDSSDEDEEDEESKSATKETVKKKLKKDKDDIKEKSQKKVADELVEESKSTTKLEDLKKEAQRLKRELISSKQKEKDGDEKEKKMSGDDPKDVVSAYQAERQKYKEAQKKTGKKGSEREAATLAMLAKFQSKLGMAMHMREQYGDPDDKETEEEEELEEGEERDEDENNDFSWLSHKLSFEASNQKVIDANVEDLDRYEIFDPRNPLNKRRREASKQAMKDKPRR